MKIINKTNNNVIARDATLADSMLTRMVGLLKHDSLQEEEALIITKCNSIHMFFMKFAIDAVFVSKDHVVVGLVENIKPWQLSPIFFTASYVVELPSGTISRQEISLKNLIEIV